MPAPIDLPSWPPSQTQLGRLLSWAESHHEEAFALAAGLHAGKPSAWRIGISGSPGAGKSTLIARLIEHWAGKPIALLAVDPSSQFSGGAVLADRLRLGSHAANVFTRSLASRGGSGGLSPASPACAALLEAAGFDPLLIETVGIGQTGADILGLADTIAVLFSPESGDGVQMLKAGLLEACDIAVVSKADRPGAEAMQSEIRLALALAQGDGHSSLDTSGHELCAWHPPVLAVDGLSGQGIVGFATALHSHREWLNGLPAGHPRSLRRLESEMRFGLRSQVDCLLHGELSARMKALAGEVACGELAMHEAARLLRTELLSMLQAGDSR